MMRVRHQGLLAPSMPIDMFITVYIGRIRLPSLIRAAAFYIDQPPVSLPDAFRPLYFKVQAARTRQSSIVGQRDENTLSVSN